MPTLPPLPDWVALEHRVAHLMTKQELHGWYFNERAAWQLASALQKELEETKKYYEKGTLSSKARRSILKEITKYKDTFKAARQPGSKS